jgi:hypothetical protein
MQSCKQEENHRAWAKSSSVWPSVSLQPSIARPARDAEWTPPVFKDLVPIQMSAGYHAPAFHEKAAQSYPSQNVRPQSACGRDSQFPGGACTSRWVFGAPIVHRTLLDLPITKGESLQLLSFEVPSCNARWTTLQDLNGYMLGWIP